VNRENDAKENNVTPNKSDCDYYMSRLNQLLNRNKQVNDRYGIDNANAPDVKVVVHNNNVVSAEVRAEREPGRIVKCPNETSSTNRLDMIQQRLALIRENRQN